MATGIIGALQGAGTITYTTDVAAKVKINYWGDTNTAQAIVKVNGVTVAGPGLASPAYGEMTHWVGAGQTLTVTCASSAAAIVSCLEG